MVVRNGRFVFAALCLGLSAPLGAQAVSFPFKGEITADRLNVRIAPKTDDEWTKVDVLSRGDAVTVVGEEGTFYAILPTPHVGVWIWSNNIEKKGNSGTVKVSSAPFRSDSRATAPQLGTLAEGTTVEILRDHLGWHFVKPPDTVRCYVSKKYVKQAGAADTKGGGIVTASTKLPSPKSRELAEQAWTEVQRNYTLLERKLIERVNFNQAIQLFEQAATETGDESLKRDNQYMAVTFRMMQNTIDREKQNVATIQQLMGQMNDLLVKKATPKTWAYEGYIETVGQFFGRPGTHKVVSEIGGGKIVCYLRVEDEVLLSKLKDLFHRRVGVNGQTLSEAFYGTPVMLLEEIEEKIK